MKQQITDDWFGTKINNEDRLERKSKAKMKGKKLSSENLKFNIFNGNMDAIVCIGYI